jgi:site-specific recombinase XerD
MPRLSEDQMTRLLATCDAETLDGVRDAAILWLFFVTDAELRDIAALEASDADIHGGTVRLSGQRLVLAPDAAAALASYVRARERLPHAVTAPLWLGRHADFTSGDVARMVRERGDAAGVGDAVHPHHAH